MWLHIVPSPLDEIELSRYIERELPAFGRLQEAAVRSLPLRQLLGGVEEDAGTVVLENAGAKDLTALAWRWTFVDAEEKSRTRTFSVDSYGEVGTRPVAASGSRLRLTPDGGIGEVPVEGVQAARYTSGRVPGARTAQQVLPGVMEVWFQLDLLLFADGELAGSDPDRFALELQCRGRAAGYVEQQIRAAMAEGRDAAPILAALRDVPHLHDDALARTVSRFAREALRRSAHTSTHAFDASLKYLESRPELPEFYRRT